MALETSSPAAALQAQPSLFQQGSFVSTSVAVLKAALVAAEADRSALRAALERAHTPAAAPAGSFTPSPTRGGISVDSATRARVLH